MILEISWDPYFSYRGERIEVLMVTDCENGKWGYIRLEELAEALKPYLEDKT